ncbi:adhesion G-protein coupled receptor D1-like [Anneissia japonica]|uniref:adhesion G-protein coupled receptor D1-like n=1 Tax=Anneissia japonica TaxID=1529436 RepID=UPI0014258FDF|nr:adhesion G-protein coupled receptor D1-like [Anneissia japonica]
MDPPLKAVGLAGTASNIAVSAASIMALVKMAKLKSMPESNIVRNVIIAVQASNVALLAETSFDKVKTRDEQNALAMALQYAVVLVFLWLFILIIDLCIDVFRPSWNKRHRKCCYHAFAWTFPLLIVALTCGPLWDEYTSSQYRNWPNPENGAIWGLIIPICVFILGALIGLIVLLCCSITSKKDGDGDSHQMLKLLMYGGLVLLLGSLWIFGVIALTNVGLQYLFTMANAMMGGVILKGLMMLSKMSSEESSKEVVDVKTEESNMVVSTVSATKSNVEVVDTSVERNAYYVDGRVVETAFTGPRVVQTGYGGYGDVYGEDIIVRRVIKRRVNDDYAYAPREAVYYDDTYGGRDIMERRVITRNDQYEYQPREIAYYDDSTYSDRDVVETTASERVVERHVSPEFRDRSSRSYVTEYTDVYETVPTVRKSERVYVSYR